MKNINPLDTFDEHFLLEKLTKLNDHLVKLVAHIGAASENGSQSTPRDSMYPHQ